MSFLLQIQSFLQAFFASCMSLFKVLIMSRYVKKLPSASQSDLVVLGNGPSLVGFLDQHIDFLINKSVLAVNHFVNTDAYVQIKPTYYLVNVPEFWTDVVDEDVRQKKEQVIADLLKKTQWNMHLFLGIDAKKSEAWHKLSQENKHIKIHYFNTTPIDGFVKFRYFCYQKQCGMPRPHNVLIPSLILAINMKFKNIFVTGADHNWMKSLYVAEDNTVYLTQKHFYDAQTASPDVMKSMGKGQRKMHEILIKFVHAFKGYFDIDAYAKSRNVKIINITPGSFIDAFSRLKL